MFNLRYRDRLPPVVRTELDQLVTGIKQYLLVSHDDSGVETAAAGIDLTNLSASNLTSGTVPLARLTGLTDSQIGAAAGIAYSKLTLTGSIVNADVATAAAIATSKIDFSGALTIGGTLTAASLFQSASGNDIVVNANGANRDIIFKINGTEFARMVGSTGRFSLADGQLGFPSVQNASADANTLDDYKEQVWTPALASSGGQSGQVYATQSGHYIKIGREVFFHGTINVTTRGTFNAGAMSITGLPFTSAGWNEAGGCFFVRVQNTGSFVRVTGQVASSVSAIALYGAAAAGADAALQNTDLTGAPYLEFHGHYTASA